MENAAVESLFFKGIAPLWQALGLHWDFSTDQGVLLFAGKLAQDSIQQIKTYLHPGALHSWTTAEDVLAFRVREIKAADEAHRQIKIASIRKHLAVGNQIQVFSGCEDIPRALKSPDPANNGEPRMFTITALHPDRLDIQAGAQTFRTTPHRKPRVVQFTKTFSISYFAVVAVYEQGQRTSYKKT